MKTKDITKIWAKTIMLGGILPALLGLSGGIFACFYVYFLLILISGSLSIPLLFMMHIVVKYNTSRKKIVKFYFISAVMSILITLFFIMLQSNEIGYTAMTVIGIGAYYMLITVLIGVHHKFE